MTVRRFKLWLHCLVHWHREAGIKINGITRECYCYDCPYRP